MAYQQQYHPYNNYAQYSQPTPQPVYTPDFTAVTQLPFPAGTQTPLPRPKNFTRNVNSANGHAPPKSALKHRSDREHRSRSRPHREEEKRRGREQRDQPDAALKLVNSIPSQHSHRGERSVSRQRTNSRVNFIPDHIFVTLKGSNELAITNLVEEGGISKVAEVVANMWPDGYDEMESRRHRWRVVFHGSPWTASGSGEDGVCARRIIRNIFVALASLGFMFTSITKTSRFAPPSLLFSRIPMDIFNSLTFEFFVLSMSNNHRRLTFIEAPESIVRNLAVDLKQSFPYQIASDRMAEHGMLVLEIKDRTSGAPPLDRHLFIAWVLQYVSRKGHALEATVPLGRKTFGLGARKEVWIFRRRGQLGV